jgi:hypothetical protein
MASNSYYSPYGTNRVGRDTFGPDGAAWWGKQFLDTETDSDGRYAYGGFNRAIGGNHNFQNFLDYNFGKYRNQYVAEAAQQQEPTPWTDWLMNNQDRMVQDFAALSPTQRGESPRKTGRLRWL